MKRIVSILLLLLILLSGISVKIASHYCGGYFSAIKISLDGELASCGMEGSQGELPLHGTNLAKHCCDDFVTFCGTDSNYIPSFKFVTESCQYNFQLFTIPSALSANSFTGSILMYTDASPPEALMYTNVDLCYICVFRI